MEHEVISMIKSCIVSRKGGLPLIHIDDEYREFAGESIPFRKMGFKTLGSLISSIPDIVLQQAKDGTTLLNVVDKKTAHITGLVENQKSTRKKKQPVFKESPSYKQKENYMKKRNIQRTSLGKENTSSQEYMLKHQMNSSKSKDRTYYSRRNDDTPIGQRSARMVDNMLRITVRADSSSDTQICYTSTDEEDILDVGPSFCDHQMIGDDFFLCIAKFLHSWMNHRRGPLGLCASGQTIRQCYNVVKKTNTLADKVMILIGAVDILEGKDILNMKDDMLDLLEIVTKRTKNVVIVTIPPLVNICHIQDKWSTLIAFNSWLKQFPTDYRCQTVDIWPLLKEENMYDFYQAEPRKMVGSSAYIVLWNHLGCKRITEALQNKIYARVR